MSYSSLFTSGLRRTQPEEIDQETQSTHSSLLDGIIDTHRRSSEQSRPSRPSSVSLYKDTQPDTQFRNIPPHKSKTRRLSPRRSSWSVSLPSKSKLLSSDTRSIYSNMTGGENEPFEGRTSIPKRHLKHSEPVENQRRGSLKVVTSPIASMLHHQIPPPTPAPSKDLPSIPRDKRQSLSFLSMSDSPLEVIENEEVVSGTNSPRTRTSHPTHHLSNYDTPVYNDQHLPAGKKSMPTSPALSNNNTTSTSSKHKGGLLHRLFHQHKSPKPRHDDR